MRVTWRMPCGSASDPRISIGISILAHGLLLGIAGWLLPHGVMVNATRPAFQTGNALKDKGISITLVEPDAAPQPLPAPGEPVQRAAAVRQPDAGPASAVEPAPPPMARSGAVAPKAAANKKGRASGLAAKTVQGSAAFPEAAHGSGKVAPIPSPPVAEPGNPKPLYPELARKRGQEGLVRLRCQVDGSGAVTRVEVAASSGHRLLDEAALRAVRQWRFRPALAGTVVVPVEFRLR